MTGERLLANRCISQAVHMTTDHLVPADLRTLYHRDTSWFPPLAVSGACCGGGLSPISQQINAAFARRGWRETKFETKIVVDDVEYAAPTHLVDCFKGRVALELEWNNKDPFFDRNLNNFRLLFDLRAIDVGVIITSATELQPVFQELGKGATFGNSTTHHRKLWPRLEGGGGGGCPVLTFAITRALYVDDGPAALQQALQQKIVRDSARTRAGRGRASPDAESED